MANQNLDHTNLQSKSWQLCSRDCERESISGQIGKHKKIKFIDDKNGLIISIIIALSISSILFGILYVQSLPENSEYMNINLLDSQKKAYNYPDYLVYGENNTFSVYVEVENHMGVQIDAKVEVLITQNIITQIPVDVVEPKTSFLNSIQDGESAENICTVTFDNLGNYTVIFELWIKNIGESEYRFSDNYCVLNTKVV